MNSFLMGKIRVVGVLFLSLIFITGCTTEKSEEVTSESSANEYAKMVQTAKADYSMINIDSQYDFGDQTTLYNRADVVVSGKFIENTEVVKGITPGEIMTVYTFKVNASYKGDEIESDVVKVAVPGGIITREDYINMWEAEAEQFNLFVGKDGSDIRDLDGEETLIFNYGYDFSIDGVENYLVYLRDSSIDNPEISAYILPYYNFSIREIKDGEVTSLTVDGTTADAFLESEIIPES